MTRYHVSEDGQPRVCSAKDGACPVAGPDGTAAAHGDFKDAQEAQRFAEQVNSTTFGGSFTKSAPKPPPNWDEMGSSARDMWIERHGWPDAKVEVFAHVLEEGDRIYGFGAEQVIKSVEMKRSSVTGNRRYSVAFMDGSQTAIPINGTVLANKSKKS